MKRMLTAVVAGATAAALVAAPALAEGKSEDSNGRAGTEVSIYVTGQDLVYDSIVKTTLPAAKGPFQKLEADGPTGLQTEFGPGDQGYVGGRWWVDVDGDGLMGEGDDYFICPLLGPGHPLD